MLTKISGFPELLPNEQIAFNKVIGIIKEQFELCGFVPLDTPAVERVETLLSKGNDNEIYGIYRLAERGGAQEKDLALRFDLTVPLARYTAQHAGQLIFPYRRYHIAPVWRGERPQAGRYRQFYQCDIDIIGDEELSKFYDAESLSVIYKVFVAIGLRRFVIKLNNRNVLSGLIKSHGINDQQIVEKVVRIIDKSGKLPLDVIEQELIDLGASSTLIECLTSLIRLDEPNDVVLKHLEALSDHEEFVHGVTELRELYSMLKAFGVEESCIKLEPALARGLNYYTGTVSETVLLDHPELGSICGGGRYENLASTFGKRKLPGVGFSIGISRLIPKLIESGALSTKAHSLASTLVTLQDANFLNYCIEVVEVLRYNKINSEIYLGDKPLSWQMKYANKKGFRLVIIAGETEALNKTVTVKDMLTGAQTQLLLHDAVKFVQGLA